MKGGYLVTRREGRPMMGLEQLRQHREIVDVIDWDMTPEEAVTRYLEWGNNWSHGKNFVRPTKTSVSISL